MKGLDKRTARKIVNQLGGPGQPPEVGVQYFTVGLNPWLDVIRDEYLGDLIAEGGSAFKLVVGIYGGGKTHFLYSVRDLGWQHSFSVAYVSLKSGGECPFDKLDLVYKAIVGGLLPPITDPDTEVADVKGIENFMRYWYVKRLEQYQGEGRSAAVAREAILTDIEDIAAGSVRSISFRNAVVQALRAVANDAEVLYSEICQWLKGEVSPTPTLKRLKITQKIDRSTAFDMIRSLGQVMRLMKYSGLLVLLDEAEQVPSLGRGQREQLLNNLREFIDECGHSTFEGVMVFYAVPDGGFLNGQTAVYEALRQRLSTVFQSFNPTGVRIELENTVQEPAMFLRQVGERIIPIYSTAYGATLDSAHTGPLVESLADTVARQKWADAGYKRLFVQRLIKGLGIVREQERIPSQQELE